MRRVGNEDGRETSHTAHTAPRICGFTKQHLSRTDATPTTEKYETGKADAKFNNKSESIATGKSGYVGCRHIEEGT